MPDDPTTKTGDRAALVLPALAQGLGGLVVGGFAMAVGAVLRPAVVFPVVTGLAVGLVAQVAVRHWRIRDVRRAMLLAALGGVVAWGVEPAAAYGQTRADLASALGSSAAALRRSEGGLPAGALDAAVDRALVLGVDAARLRLDERLGRALLRGDAVHLEGDRRLPAHALPGSLEVLDGWLVHRRARMSVSLAPPLVLGAVGGVAVLTFELILLVAAAMVLAFRAATAPWCERCGGWLPEAGGVSTPLGGEERLAEAREALLALDGVALRALAAAGADTEPRLVLHLRRCPRCPGEPWLAELQHQTRLRDGVEVLTIERAWLPEAAAVVVAADG